MKTRSRILILLTGLTVSAGSLGAAYADDGARWDHGMNRGGGHGMESMFERADTDNDGTVTADEFIAAGSERFAAADADNDGNITAEEMADAMLRERLQRRAGRMIERFDSNEDGSVSLAEIEDRQRKMFALADRDNSGAIEEDELRKHGVGRGGHHRGRYGRN
ncbi:EF-hand domain-containing protein [Oricola cellulosilytica]|uniref:Acid-shock protein n=1 Tax=Oricola cellulosilytica TaxID=1429082 RepID=A0A4R0PA66_9HYPH|nr:EF-hand domain-containing protein [Oricola cellulosilytica]TCD14142.1 acid-shock protein [Oricola cellulosilytica]